MLFIYFNFLFGHLHLGHMPRVKYVLSGSLYVINIFLVEVFCRYSALSSVKPHVKYRFSSVLECVHEEVDLPEGLTNSFDRKSATRTAL